jgi:AraC family transcriptional regulator
MTHALQRVTPGTTMSTKISMPGLAVESAIPSVRPAGHRMLSWTREVNAKRILCSRLDRPVSNSEVAQACNLSRSHFTRAFKHATGLTPHLWRQAERVQHAQGLLLNSALSLADIAAACGFADQSHFTRVFAKSTGVPPGRWRRYARG